MPWTLIGTRFETTDPPRYDSPEYPKRPPAGHPDHWPHDPYATLDKAKAAADRHAGAALAWKEQILADGLNFHPWRGRPHLCAWHGTTQYLITDGICWMGWADDPALVGYNAAMRQMGRPEIQGWETSASRDHGSKPSLLGRIRGALGLQGTTPGYRA